jgi:hypothetical protein
LTALRILPAERLVINPDQTSTAARRAFMKLAPWWKARESSVGSADSDEPAAERFKARRLFRRELVASA